MKEESIFIAREGPTTVFTIPDGWCVYYDSVYKELRASDGHAYVSFPSELDDEEIIP